MIFVDRSGVVLTAKEVKERRRSANFEAAETPREQLEKVIKILRARVVAQKGSANFPSAK